MAPEPQPTPSHSSSLSAGFTADPVILINLPISTKLTAINYLSWRSQILPLLHGYNLAKFIESPPPKSSRLSSSGQFELNPEYLPWHRQDQLLLGWIRSSLTESVQSQVVSCSTTMEIWIELQKLFSSNSRSRVTELKRQIQCAQKGTCSCADYLLNLKRVFDELASIGSPYSDNELVVAAINGLGSEFNSVAAAISAASVHSPFSFSDLHGLLLGYEALLKNQTVSPQAFYTGRSNNGRERFFNQNPNVFATRPVLHNPYPPRAPFRHTTPFFNGPAAPHAPTGPNTQTQSSNLKPICQICTKIGHVGKLCYKRYDPDPEW